MVLKILGAFETEDRRSVGRIRQAMSEMLASEELKQEKDAIYLPPFYFSAVGTAHKILGLLN